MDPLPPFEKVIRDTFTDLHRHGGSSIPSEKICGYAKDTNKTTDKEKFVSQKWYGMCFRPSIFLGRLYYILLKTNIA